MAGSEQAPQRLTLPYRWAGREGEVRVELRENDDPAAHGCSEMARGFPCCRATLTPVADGYADMLGWVQLIDHSQLGEGFVTDGFQPLGTLPHPFGYYGISPTFFDAPHHPAEDLDFLAHTFLCGLGGELLEFRREARAVLGFSWGFSKRGPRIRFFDLEVLPPAVWDAHREYFERTFPEWGFAPGFQEHPLGQ